MDTTAEVNFPPVSGNRAATAASALRCMSGSSVVVMVRPPLLRLLTRSGALVPRKSKRWSVTSRRDAFTSATNGLSCWLAGWLTVDGTGVVL